MGGVVRAYSARFMSGRGANRTERFTVPEGRRAVILAFGATSWAATGSMAAQLKVHGIVIFSVNLVSGQTQLKECRLTAYQRETIEMTVVGTDVTYHCDGYLLEDPQADPDDAHNVITPFLAQTLPTLPDEPARE